MTLVWVGWLGGSLSAVQLVPQIYKLYQVKRAEDLSKTSFVIRLVSYVCYLVHGQNIQDPPLFWMTLTGLVLLCVTMCQMAWYSHAQSTEENENQQSASTQTVA